MTHMASGGVALLKKQIAAAVVSARSRDNQPLKCQKELTIKDNLEHMLPALEQTWTAQGINELRVLSIGALDRCVKCVEKARQATSKIHPVPKWSEQFCKLAIEISNNMGVFLKVCEHTDGDGSVVDGCGKVCIHSKEVCETKFGCAVNAMCSHWACTASLGITSAVWMETLRLLTKLLNNEAMQESFGKRESQFKLKVAGLDFTQCMQLLLRTKENVVPKKKNTGMYWTL